MCSRPSLAPAHTAALTLLTVALVAPRTAGGDGGCSFLQVTDLEPGSPGAPSHLGAPILSADASRLYFIADGDLAATNPDGNFEVYEVHTATLGLSQVTATSDVESKGSLSVNADGTRVAFIAGVLGAESKLVVLDRETTTVTTHDFGAGTILDADLDDAGELLYFVGDVDPGTNPERNQELFVVLGPTFTGGVLAQLTETPAGTVEAASVDATGERVVFVSSQDLGSNADGGRELFLYRRDLGSTTQLLDSPPGAAFGPPSISAEGQRIAFASRSDAAGLNPDGNSELFLYDVPTSTLAQLTNSTGGGTFDPFLGFFSHRLAFESDRDLVGDNSDLSAELFHYDGPVHAFGQATDTLGEGSVPPEVRRDPSDLVPRLVSASAIVSEYLPLRPSTDRSGERIVFRSDADLTGENADGSAEIFLAYCPHPVNSSAARYDAGLNSLPSTQGWRHIVDDPEPDDSLDESNYSVSLGALLQGDTGGPNDDAWNRQYYVQQSYVPYDFRRHRVRVTMELQILHSSLHHPQVPAANRRAGFGVWLADALGRSIFLFIGQTHLFLLGENEASSGLQPFDAADDFHRYQIDVAAPGAELRIDGALVATLALSQFRLLPSHLNSLAVGDLTQNESSSSRLRSLTLSAGELLFDDGFEAGNLVAWSVVAP